MASVRRAIEAEADKADNVRLLMNDSQNDQSKQNDQVDVMLAKGVDALAINLVDPAAAPVIIQKAKMDDVPIVFYNKEPTPEALVSYEHAYYVGTDSKESGIIQGELIAEHWVKNPDWDLNKDGVIQFVLLKGEPGHPDAEARTSYVISTLNDKGYKTQELHMDTAMWDTAMAKDKVDAWISGPNADKIEVVIANNDAMAMGAIESLKAADKSTVPVFGVDALTEALALIKGGDGNINGFRRIKEFVTFCRAEESVHHQSTNATNKQKNAGNNNEKTQHPGYRHGDHELCCCCSGWHHVGSYRLQIDDNFMASVRRAIEAEADKADNVRLLMNDSQNDQSKQNDQVDVMLAKGVDALAINLVDPAAAPVIIQKAKMDDVPIVFYNKEPTPEALVSYEHAYYVGTDSKESGIIQGELIAEHWVKNPDWDLNKDGVIQFVLLKGEPGHPDAEARTSYVISTLNDKGYKTQELHMDTAMWDTAMAKDKVDAWISGPNADKIEVVIANNDAMAMGAIESLKAADKSTVPVFGVDALTEALALIKGGEMQGTVLNDANNQAKAAFELANNLAKGKAAGEGTNWTIDNKVVRVPYVGVDKADL